MYEPHQVWNTVQRVRDEIPLVHSITNYVAYVAMDITANALLAIGASPAREAAGPGGLRWRLLDALHQLDEAALNEVRIREEIHP